MLLLFIYYLSFENFVSAQRIYLSKERYSLLEPIEIVIESFETLNIQSLDVPSIEGLDFIGSSQNYKKVQTKNIYIYYFLFKAKKIGNIKIPSFKIPSKHTLIEFKEKNIHIYSDEYATLYQKTQNNKETWSLSPQDIFLEIQFSKNQAFVGEQINQKVSLYIREHLIDKVFFEPQSVQNLLQNIKNTQFWEENIDSIPFQNVTFEYRNGLKYQKYVLNYSFLFAFFPGSIHYESIPFKIKKKKYLTHELIENPLEEVTIYSNSLDLNIIQVPFPDLLTGKFTIHYHQLPRKITLGQKVDYKFTISGNGNLHTLKIPPPMPNKPCDIFEQSQHSKQYLQHNELYYSLMFEYHIIPNDTGHYTINKLVIPYFNTQTQKKEFLIIPEFSFFVEKNNNKNTENQLFENIQNQSINFTGWNIWGVSILISITFVFLWLIYKEL